MVSCVTLTWQQVEVVRAGAGEASLRVATVAVHAGAGVLALVDVRAVAPGVVWPTQKYLLLQI